MSTSEDDRRMATRRVLRTKIQLRVREGQLMDARTLNISEKGMGIVTDGPLPPGLYLTLRCQVMAAGSRAELVTQARVVHCVFSNSDGGFAVGLVFANLSPQAMTTIAGVLAMGK